MKRQPLEKRGKIKQPCVTLIGMPGSGKTTIGKELALRLGWNFLDTDNLLEALYSCRLQDLTDLLGKERFLQTESGMIQALDVSRCVVATGGSVIYSKKAVAKLKELGPLIYLEIPLEEVERRVAENPERGIAIAPGQTLKDLFAERCSLYEEGADFRIDNYHGAVPEVVEKIAKYLLRFEA